MPSPRAELAYTTVMTVLQRLARKALVVQIRADRAHQYTPAHGRDELVAGLMVDALDQAADSVDRQAALMHFVGRVGADEGRRLAPGAGGPGSLGTPSADRKSRFPIRWRRTVG